MVVAIDNLAMDVAGTDGPVAMRAQRLTDWLHASLEWVATDYEQRTVDEILTRRAGNCAEQAQVLDALLTAAGIETRWIAEINVHPTSPQRQADSEALIPEYGLQATVFGYHHNDHRWLEIHDPDAAAWLPADATLGVVDYPAWVTARLGFGARPADAEEMLVPFCVVVLDLVRVLHENRTAHYLIDRFDAHYGGALGRLQAWSDWRDQVAVLGALGARTFQKRHDLHGERARIAALLKTYAELREQALQHGLHAT